MTIKVIDTDVLNPIGELTLTDEAYGKIKDDIEYYYKLTGGRYLTMKLDFKYKMYGDNNGIEYVSLDLTRPFKANIHP